MKVLVTGFEKFLNYDINPSERVAQTLNGKTIGNHQVVGKVIKLEYNTIRDQIREFVDEVSPDAIILIGQASRAMICLEKVAVNYADSHGSPYNCGTIVNDEILVPGGNEAFFSKLDIQNLLEHLHKKGIPAAQSLTAGSYGCNQIFYETMYYLNSKNINIPAGFVHIPMIPEQSLTGKFPTVEYTLIEEAIRTIVENLK